jgi:hypothetical protein
MRFYSLDVTYSDTIGLAAIFLKTIIPSRKATREYGIRGKP